MNTGLYYPILVKEFIINLPSSFNDVGGGDYKKVQWNGGHCFAFSTVIINEYLGYGKQIIVYHLPSLNYDMLYKIRLVKRASSTHGSNIIPNLAYLLYQIGTRINLFWRICVPNIC